MLEGLVSHVRPPGPRQNDATELLSGYMPSPGFDLRQAYAFARGVVKLSSEPEAPGHRLVWVRGASFASSMLPATEGAFRVVGRHTQCGVVLPDDPFVALRHV